MRRLWAKIIGFTAMANLLLVSIAMASGPEVAPLVMVADTRNFTGWEAWWVNLYNESHILFALLTVAIIPVVGLCFGLLADVVMNWIGIDLKHRELAEH